MYILQINVTIKVTLVWFDSQYLLINEPNM